MRQSQPIPLLTLVQEVCHSNVFKSYCILVANFHTAPAISAVAQLDFESSPEGFNSMYRTSASTFATSCTSLLNDDRSWAKVRMVGKIAANLI